MARVKVLRDNKTNEIFYPVTSVNTVFNSEGQSVQLLLDADSTRFDLIETDIININNWPVAGITTTDISNWNNKSDFSGSYTDLSNKPTITGTTGKIVTIDSTGNWITASDKTINDILEKTTITHNTTDHSVLAGDGTSVSVFSSADLANIVIGDVVEDVGDAPVLIEAVYKVIDKSSDTEINQFEIAPNIKYLFGERSQLIITLGHVLNPNIVNEYQFEFISGNVATQLLLPSNIKWIKDPLINSNATYACSIENNLGIIGEWKNE